MDTEEARVEVQGARREEAEGVATEGRRVICLLVCRRMPHPPVNNSENPSRILGECSPKVHPILHHWRRARGRGVVHHHPHGEWPICPQYNQTRGTYPLLPCTSQLISEEALTYTDDNVHTLCLQYLRMPPLPRMSQHEGCSTWKGGHITNPSHGWAYIAKDHLITEFGPVLHCLLHPLFPLCLHQLLHIVPVCLIFIILCVPLPWTMRGCDTWCLLTLYLISHDRHSLRA